MSIIIKNKLNKLFQESNLDTSKVSIYSKGSDYQSNNSKKHLKGINYSDINTPKNKNQAIKIYSKLKMDQINNFKKKKQRNSSYLYRKNINRSITNITKSPEQKQKHIPKHFSMKALEKNIQQKILDISMKIEEESTLIKENINKLNVSLFIKRKLGKDDSNYNNSSFKNNKKIKNNTYIGKRVNYNVSPKKDDNIKLRHYPSYKTFYKFNKKKKKKEKFRILFKKNMIYDSFDSEEQEELEHFFISPNNKIILTIDALTIISTILYLIYTPFYLSSL